MTQHCEWLTTTSAHTVLLESADPAPQKAEVHCKSLSYCSESFTILQVGLDGGEFELI